MPHFLTYTCPMQSHSFSAFWFFYMYLLQKNLMLVFFLFVCLVTVRYSYYDWVLGIHCFNTHPFTRVRISPPISHHFLPTHQPAYKRGMFYTYKFLFCGLSTVAESFMHNILPLFSTTSSSQLNASHTLYFIDYILKWEINHGSKEKRPGPLLLCSVWLYV